MSATPIAFAGTPNTAPEITSINAFNSDGGSTFSAGDDIILSGTANDDEDGDLSDTITWEIFNSDNIKVSERNGRIVVIPGGLSPGTYEVQATVEDSEGESDSDSITITVDEKTGQRKAVMYGVTGAAGPDPGSLVLVNQNDGSQILIADNTGLGPNNFNLGLSGLAITDDGRMWASQVEAGHEGTVLLELDPSNGDILDSCEVFGQGSINKISDLTSVGNALYGITSNSEFVSINRSSCAVDFIATLDDVGALAWEPFSKFFYHVDRGDSFSLFTRDLNFDLLFPETGRSPGDYELDALGIGLDGTLWGAGTHFQGNGPEIVTIDTDGTIAIIGSGERNISDLAFFFLTDKDVSGELLPIDYTALMLAGLQSSAIWMIPTLAGLAAVGFYVLKSRTNKE